MSRAPRRYRRDEPCDKCGTHERYVKDKSCCECRHQRVRRMRADVSFERRNLSPTIQVEPYALRKKRPLPPPHVAPSGFIAPPTKAQLMARR